MFSVKRLENTNSNWRIKRWGNPSYFFAEYFLFCTHIFIIDVIFGKEVFAAVSLHYHLKPRGESESSQHSEH